jgi:uncharacterized damage-inducible protein DinB
MTNDDLRYPVGKFRAPDKIGADERNGWIGDISRLPAQLRSAVADLDDQQLATPYRPGGWTVRQVIHHLPDSHLNSYTRFRLALTEDNPVIKPYNEHAWAELTDAQTAPIELSLSLLDCLHERWVILLKSLTEQDFERTFQHPESGQRTLGWNLGLYAWHGKHHLAQITHLRARQGW